MDEDRAFRFSWQKGIIVIMNGQTTLYETALLCKLRVSLLNQGPTQASFTAAHEPDLAKRVLELEFSVAEQARSD